MQEQTKIAWRWLVIGIIVGVAALALLLYVRERRAAGVGFLSTKPPTYCHDVEVRFSTNSNTEPNGASPDPFIICGGKGGNRVTFMPNETEKIVYFKVQFISKTPFQDEGSSDKFEFHSPDPLPASCTAGLPAAPPVTTNPAKGPCFLCSREYFKYSLDFCAVGANGNASTSHFDPGGIVMK